MPLIFHKHTGVDSPKVKAKDILDMILKENAMLTDTAQTVAGIKTHTSIPELPASDATADNEWIRKKQVDDLFGSDVVETDTYLIDSADTERAIDQDQSTYTKKKDITFNEEDGDITVKFSMKDDNGSGGCFGRVYINGVAQGTEREETTAVYTEYTEDFAVTTGDLIQLYMKYDKTGGGVGGNTKNFRLYYYKKLTITVGTVNTD